MKKSLKSKLMTFVIGSFALISSAAYADSATTPASNGVDLTALTSTVNFDGVLAGIMAIAGTLIGLYAGYVGVRWVLRMVKGA